jgi:general secretion pathway protein D
MNHRLSKFAVLLCAALWANFPAPSSAAGKQVKYGVDQPIEQIEFRDVTVGDALRILSEQSTLNIIASKQAADIHVTMFLRRVTPNQVIEALAKTYNLWYQQDWDSNIVRIYTVKEYRLEQVEFKKEETEIFTLKNAKNALDLAETIQNLFLDRVFLSYGKSQNELMNDLTQRFQRFDIIDGRTTIGNSSGSNGGGGGGSGGGQGNFGGSSGQGSFGQGGSGTGQSGQNNRQTQLYEPLKSTADVIKKLDDGKDGGQLDLLSGDIERSRSLVDAGSRHQAPIYVGVIKAQNRVLVRTRDADAMNEIRQLYKRLDIQSAMLLMEVKILSIDLSDGFNSLFDFKVKNVGGGFDVSTMGALNQALNTASAAFDPSFLATFVSDNFEARLQLLENENRVTELATPMLLTTNQEVSKVFVGEERPIVSGYTSSSTTGTSTGGLTTTVVSPILVPETETQAIGTTLLLTPNINADRTVSMQILVESSTIGDQQATIPVQVGDSLEDANIDVVQEQTFSGTVVAQDGTSVAVGGLIEEAASNNEKKVPVLGDIPLLGFFFREDDQSRSRTELVVIIKPHIIGTPNEAQAFSRDMLKNNSVHPNAENAGNMDVYSNPDRVHKGYKLEQPLKEYNNQDSLDRYQWDYPNPRR